MSCNNLFSHQKNYFALVPKLNITLIPLKNITKHHFQDQCDHRQT